jgi:hypothetical protein
MRKLILIFGILCCLAAGFSQAASLSGLANSFADFDNAIFNWLETTFDFGKIKQNKPVTHEFDFVNKGTSPLIISSVKASCGCTVAEYSKDPIAPGQQGFVKATYNAAHAGAFTKTVTINANTDNAAVVLTIKGEVVE